MTAAVGSRSCCGTRPLEEPHIERDDRRVVESEQVIADVDLDGRPAGNLRLADALRKPRSLECGKLVACFRYRLRRSRQMKVEKIHLRRLWLDDQAIDRRQRSPEGKRPCAIRRHLGELCVETHGGRCDKRVQLDQRAALTAPPDACLADEIPGAEQHRSSQRTNPLVERYVDRIEKRSDFGKGLRRIELARLPQACAVQVQYHAAL